MRKVVLYIACSLDGYIAGVNDEIDWLFADQDYGYSKFLDTVDTILMGRRSWVVVNSFGDWPYGERCGVVFSRTVQNSVDPLISWTNQPPAEIVTQMKTKPARRSGSWGVVS
jgi:dihydrofolate reductase